MTRDQLEHIVRAAAYIVDDDELIVVGSQARISHHGAALVHMEPRLSWTGMGISAPRKVQPGRERRLPSFREDVLGILRRTFPAWKCCSQTSQDVFPRPFSSIR